MPFFGEAYGPGCLKGIFCLQAAFLAVVRAVLSHQSDNIASMIQ